MANSEEKSNFELYIEACFKTCLAILVSVFIAFATVALIGTGIYYFITSNTEIEDIKECKIGAIDKDGNYLEDFYTEHTYSLKFSFCNIEHTWKREITSTPYFIEYMDNRMYSIYRKGRKDKNG